MSTNDTPDAPFDPAQALAAIHSQQETNALRLDSSRLYLMVWGLAYTIGYLPYALRVGPDALVPDLPGIVVGVTLAVAVAAGIVASIVVAARQGKGVRGPGSRIASIWGYCWMLAFIPAALLGKVVGESGASFDAIAITMTAFTFIVSSVLYLAGGAIFRSPDLVLVGLVMGAVNFVAGLIGPPVYFWVVVAVIGPFSFLAGLFNAPLRRALNRRWPLSATGGES